MRPLLQRILTDVDQLPPEEQWQVMNHLMTQLQPDFINVVTAGQNTTFIPIDATVGQIAATLRATYNLKLPDSLKLASAIAVNCDAFLTNDD